MYEAIGKRIKPFGNKSSPVVTNPYGTNWQVSFELNREELIKDAGDEKRYEHRITKSIYEEHVLAATQARDRFLKNKDSKLTDRETFAIAFVAGVKIDFKGNGTGNGFSVDMVTEMVGVAWDHEAEKFIVATQQQK